MNEKSEEMGIPGGGCLDFASAMTGKRDAPLMRHSSNFGIWCFLCFLLGSHSWEKEIEMHTAWAPARTAWAPAHTAWAPARTAWAPARTAWAPARTAWAPERDQRADRRFVRIA
jgi:hypothetical protein